MGVKVFILTMILLFPVTDGDQRPATVENYRHFGVFFQAGSCRQEAEDLATEFNQYAEQQDDFEGYAYFTCLEVDVPANY